MMKQLTDKPIVSVLEIGELIQQAFHTGVTMLVDKPNEQLATFRFQFQCLGPFAGGDGRLHTLRHFQDGCQRFILLCHEATGSATVTVI